MTLSAGEREVVSGNTSRVRVADHRSRHVRLDVSVSPRTGSTLDEIAS